MLTCFLTVEWKITITNGACEVGKFYANGLKTKRPVFIVKATDNSGNLQFLLESALKNIVSHFDRKIAVALNVSQTWAALIKSFVNFAMHNNSMECFMCCHKGDEQSVADIVDSVYQEQKEKGFYHTKYTDTVSFKNGESITC